VQLVAAHRAHQLPGPVARRRRSAAGDQQAEASPGAVRAHPQLGVAGAEVLDQREGAGMMLAATTGGAQPEGVRILLLGARPLTAPAPEQAREHAATGLHTIPRGGL